MGGGALTLMRTPVADMGAAYGTAKSGVGIASMGVLKPEMVMRSIIPARPRPDHWLARAHAGAPMAYRARRGRARARA